MAGSIAERRDAGSYDGVLDEPLCQLAQGVCASPEYLERRTAPKHPHDLADHECLMFRPTGATWMFRTHRGPINLDVPTKLAANDTSMLIAELLAGVALLPAGKRKRELDRRLRASLSRLFHGRILLFDLAAAESYAQIAGEARRAGRTVPHEDGPIAAIARAHGFAVATRNLSSFAGAGVELINPWDLP